MICKKCGIGFDKSKPIHKHKGYINVCGYCEPTSTIFGKSRVKFKIPKSIEKSQNDKYKYSRWIKYDLKKSILKFTFGKYKDKNLNEIPTDYLEWATKTIENEVLKQHILIELKRRKKI